MKRLILLRHAKSQIGNPGQADRQRTLNERGVRDAQAMAAALAAHGPQPERILCSSSRRTRDTLAALLPQLNANTEITITDALYDGGPEAYVEAIRNRGGDAGVLLVIGHNPGLQHFVLRLAGAGSDESVFTKIEAKFATAALARFTLDGDWANLDYGGARLTHYLRPKDLG